MIAGIFSCELKVTKHWLISTGLDVVDSIQHKLTKVNYSLITIFFEGASISCMYSQSRSYLLAVHSLPHFQDFDKADFEELIIVVNILSGISI